jgi:membrane-associated protease RseP (regulator of RpoE activity)
VVPRPPDDALRAQSDALRATTDALRASFSFPRETISTARWALHWLLLGLTLCSTTLVGVVFADEFRSGSALKLSDFYYVFQTLHHAPALLLSGLAYSLTLMTILLAHELGHYFACQYYGIDASLPYFLPFPSPIGTLGAFIRIRSPIYTKRALFDVGIAGPIAGFLVLLPMLAVGVALSKQVHGLPDGDFAFGVPLIERAFELIRFPHTPSSAILLHPIARAAWVGTLATALNLLPIGQLDGGHILYAFFGRRHKALSRIFVLALIPMGFYSVSWWVWAALLFFFALRHPVIYDITPLDKNRIALGITALAILLLTFTLVPLR